MENNEVFNFDSVIENDGEQFLVLEDGDYDYKVTNFERGNFPGGNKIPPCLKATITVEVVTKEGKATVKTDLMLAKADEWKLCAFFRSIGQKKSGEPLKPNWNLVVGSTGRAHFKKKTFVNKDGIEKTVNEIDRFIDKQDSNSSEDELPF